MIAGFWRETHEWMLSFSLEKDSLHSGISLQKGAFIVLYGFSQSPCNLCASPIFRCPIGSQKLQTWQIHIWLNIFVFYWKMKLYVQVCVQKNKDNFLENMLDHCAKFCKRVTDVSMSSSSWQRNFNKTLNSCIIPEEKVKTPS